MLRSFAVAVVLSVRTLTGQVSDGLERASAMAKQLEKLDDSRVAIDGLAKLGEMVCRHDPATAATIFRTGAARVKKAAYGGSLRAAARLLMSAAQCNPSLGPELGQTVAAPRMSPAAAETELRRAREQMRDNEVVAAADRIEPVTAIFRELGVEQQAEFVVLLLNVRAREAERADTLFADALYFAALDPGGALPSLFMLGNYLYASPDMTDAEPGKQRSFLPIEVAGFLLYDLTAPRPETSPDTSAVYLHAVRDALDAAAKADVDHVRRVALAEQLQPRAAEFSGQLGDQYRAHSNQAALRIAGELAGALVRRFHPVETVPATITTSGRISDQQRLERFHSLWSAGQFTSAAAAATDIRAVAIRDQLLDLAGFGQAKAALDKGDAGLALSLTREVRPGVKRSLLYLSIANAVAAEDKARAAQMLPLAGSEHDKTAKQHRPWLWTAQASIAAALEPELGFFALSQAISAFNEADSDSGSASAVRGSEFGFSERVRVGDSVRHFRLAAPGINTYSLPRLLAALGDLNRVESLLPAIRNAARRIAAQLEVIRMRLVLLP